MASFFQPVRGETVSDFDKWFEGQLKRFWSEGFGKGVLVLRIPAELLRHPDAPEADDEWANDQLLPFSHIQASEFHNGCFFLIDRRAGMHHDSFNNIRNKISSETVSADYRTFQKALVEGRATRYSDGIDVTLALRNRLGLDDLPFSQWGCGSLSQTTEPTPGIHTPFLYIAATGDHGAAAPFALHVEDSFLYSLNYLHAGAPKYWVVVHPHDGERLERRLRDSYRPRGAGDANPRACSQFVRHLCVWVPVETLDRWNIRYTRVEQRAGELVVTAPGAYHQGWNGGWNVAEAINYGDARSPARTRGYCYCREGRCPVAPLIFEWPGECDLEVPALTIREWTTPKSDELLMLSADADIEVVQRRLQAKKPLTVAETNIATSALLKILSELSQRAPCGYILRKPLKDAATTLNEHLKRRIAAEKDQVAALETRKRQNPVPAAIAPRSAQETSAAEPMRKRSKTTASSGSTSGAGDTPGTSRNNRARISNIPRAITTRTSARINPRVAENQNTVTAATSAITRNGSSGQDQALSILADVAQNTRTPEAADHVSSTALVLRNNRSVEHDDDNQTMSTDRQTALVVAAPNPAPSLELVVAGASEVALVGGDVSATTEASLSTASIDADTTSADADTSPTDPPVNSDSAVEIYKYLDHRATIISNPDTAYTLICTDAAFDLEEWRAADAGDGFRAQARLLLLGDVQRAVRDEHGALWSEGAMLRRIYGAAAHSVRARFYRNVGLVQLAAWVAERQRAPDVRARHPGGSSERERYTAVLDMLVRHDGRQRGRDSWRRECTAGRHWMAFVERFGVGVAIVKPRLLGLNSKGLGNVSQDAIDKVMATLQSDAVFAEITAKMTTRIKAFHMDVDAAARDEALQYLRDASLGRRPWAAVRPLPGPASLPLLETARPSGV